VTARPLNELVEQGWATALEPVADQVAQLGQFLRDEITAGRKYLPPGQTCCAPSPFRLMACAC